VYRVGGCGRGAAHLGEASLQVGSNDACLGRPQPVRPAEGSDRLVEVVAVGHLDLGSLGLPSVEPDRHPGHRPEEAGRSLVAAVAELSASRRGGPAVEPRQPMQLFKHLPQLQILLCHELLLGNQLPLQLLQLRAVRLEIGQAPMPRLGRGHRSRSSTAGLRLRRDRAQRRRAASDGGPRQGSPRGPPD
jgi:hypothetical protein